VFSINQLIKFYNVNITGVDVEFPRCTQPRTPCAKNPFQYLQSAASRPAGVAADKMAVGPWQELIGTRVAKPQNPTPHNYGFDRAFGISGIIAEYLRTGAKEKIKV
jgi:hypothetical protein